MVFQFLDMYQTNSENDYTYWFSRQETVGEMVQIPCDYLYGIAN